MFAYFFLLILNGVWTFFKQTTMWDIKKDKMSRYLYFRGLCIVKKKHSKMGKGRGPTRLLSIEPNWPLPDSTLPVTQLTRWGMPGRRAGSPVAVQYIYVRTKPRAQNRTEKGSTFMKEEKLSPSGYIAYLSLGLSIHVVAIICTLSKMHRCTEILHLMSC